MSKNKKSLQDLTLLDRFLFAEVMEDSMKGQGEAKT